MLDETTVATPTGVGWSPGRDDHWTAQLRLEGIGVHPAAEAFLREFGGLVVEQKGQGPSHALAFELDPSTCVGEGDRFLDWQEESNRQIVPVDELNRLFTKRPVGDDE